MRILYLALDVDLHANRGDAVHVREIAVSLAKLGHDVFLVVGGGSLKALQVEVALSTCSKRTFPGILGLVTRIARKFRPDVIIERRYSPKVSASASRLLGVPFVVEYNGLPEEESAMQQRPLSTSPVSRTKSAVRRRLLSDASAIVAVSAGLGIEIAARYGIDSSRIFVVPNGVDPLRFYPQDRAESRRHLELPDLPLITFVGNIVRWQGLDTLIATLPEAPEDVEVVLVGNGPDSSRIRAAAERRGISGRLHWSGCVAHDKVPLYIAAADACIAPFTSERNVRIGLSPLKIYEYVACGRPVITTDIPGVAELIREYGCGLAVAPENPSALAQAISTVLDDPSYAAAAMTASGAVRERFSWNRSAQTLAGILETGVRRFALRS